MAGLLNEDVFWLQIAVGNAHAVEMLESANDLRQVEADDGGREDAVNLAVEEDVEVAAGAIRGGPTEKLIGFNSAEEGREEGVGQASEDVDFPASSAVGVVEVGVAGINGGFGEELEGERGEGRGIREDVVDEEDGAHATFAEDFECSEVVQVKLRRGWSCRFHLSLTERKGERKGVLSREGWL